MLLGFTACLWTCNEGDTDFPPEPDPIVVVDCVKIGDDLDLLSNTTGITRSEPTSYFADLNEDGQTDLKIKYDLLNAVSGAWREELEFYDIDPSLKILGSVSVDTLISFYRDNCYYQINKEAYTPETIDSLVTEEILDYLEIERLDSGTTVCVDDVPDSYSNAIALYSYFIPQNQYVCGVVRYKLGNWENERSTGYVVFVLESDPYNYIGYLKIENGAGYGTLITEIRYQRSS